MLTVPEGVDVRKVDLSIELQILAFHAQRRSAGPLSRRTRGAASRAVNGHQQVMAREYPAREYPAQEFAAKG